jgi:hypothetical protein
MNEPAAVENLAWNPLAWAADCRAQAHFDAEPEARAAFIQLAEEFEGTAAEIVGLIAAVEALGRHKRSTLGCRRQTVRATHPFDELVG